MPYNHDPGCSTSHSNHRKGGAHTDFPDSHHLASWCGRLCHMWYPLLSSLSLVGTGIPVHWLPFPLSKLISRWLISTWSGWSKGSDSYPSGTQI